MMSRYDENGDDMPENIDKGARIRNNMDIRLQNPTIRECFDNNQNEIRNPGYVDNIKMSGNARTLPLNPHGCRPKNKSKIIRLKQLIKQY